MDGGRAAREDRSAASEDRDAHPGEANPEMGLHQTDGGADDRTGRVPVLITVRYFVGDDPRTASGVYDVIWRTKGQFLGGRSLRIEGMKLRQRGGSPASLDAAWQKLKP